MLAVVQTARIVLDGIVTVLRRPVPCVRACRIDPNRASIAELTTLEGIGPTRAAAIVLHRVRHGPFLHLDDLLRIDGIGPETLHRIVPFLVDPGAGAECRRP